MLINCFFFSKTAHPQVFYFLHSANVHVTNPIVNPNSPGEFHRWNFYQKVWIQVIWQSKLSHQAAQIWPEGCFPPVLYPCVCSHYYVDLPRLHLASYYVTLHLVMNSIPLRGIIPQGWFEISICNSSDNKNRLGEAGKRSDLWIRLEHSPATYSSVESSYSALPDRNSRKHDKVSSLRHSATVHDVFAERHVNLHLA